MSISVVIPVFNGARYLGQAIRSVLDQTLPPQEIIVVDDGSTDESREIARSFGNKVVCLAQANQGPSAARNLGIRKAAGKWIALLDADDYWLPHKLMRQAEVIQKDDKSNLVYTGRTELLPDGTIRDVPAREFSWVKERLAYENPLFPSTVLAKRSLLLEYPWTESFKSSEDWWMFYRLSRNALFAPVVEPTVVYRIHPESLTHSRWDVVLQQAYSVAKTIQADFAGLERKVLSLRVASRLYGHAGVAAREQKSPEYLSYMTRSLLMWPLPTVWPARYKIWLKMLSQKLQSAHGKILLRYTSIV